MSTLAHVLEELGYHGQLARLPADERERLFRLAFGPRWKNASGYFQHTPPCSRCGSTVLMYGPELELEVQATPWKAPLAWMLTLRCATCYDAHPIRITISS